MNCTNRPNFVNAVESTAAVFSNQSHAPSTNCQLFTRYKTDL